MNKFRKPHGNSSRDGGRFSNQGPGRPGGFEQRPARTRFGGPRPEGVELFDAVCSKCSNACQVPFRPNGKKPVYCRACFGSPAVAGLNNKENFIRRDAPERSFEPKIEERGGIDIKRQMDAMNIKMDSILRIVEFMARTVTPVTVVASVAPKEEVKKVFEKDLSEKKVAKKKVVAKKKK